MPSFEPRHSPLVDAIDQALDDHDAELAEAQRPSEAVTLPNGYWLGWVGSGGVRGLLGCWPTEAEALEARTRYGADLDVYVTGQP